MYLKIFHSNSFFSSSWYFTNMCWGSLKRSSSGHITLTYTPKALSEDDLKEYFENLKKMKFPGKFTVIGRNIDWKGKVSGIQLYYLCLCFRLLSQSRKIKKFNKLCKDYKAEEAFFITNKNNSYNNRSILCSYNTKIVPFTKVKGGNLWDNFGR